jgi:cyclase
MRRGARALIPGLLFLLPLVLQGQSSKVTSVEKVAEGVWMAQTAQGSNAGWFVLGDEVIAVDAGGDPETGKALLEKIKETAGKPVRYLIITHAHGDHAGGVGPFLAAGAEIVCQESASPSLGAITAASPRANAMLLSFSERFSLFAAKRGVAMYFLGTAHSASDIVVLLPDEKVLFTGDIVIGKRAPYMQSPDVDPKGWQNILGRLAQLDAQKVVPGHGTLGDRQIIGETLGYVKKLNELAQMLISEGVPDAMIEARLRRPDSGIEESAITPDLLANLRAVVRADKKAPAPAPKPARAPAKKKK